MVAITTRAAIEQAFEKQFQQLRKESCTIARRLLYLERHGSTNNNLHQTLQEEDNNIEAQCALFDKMKAMLLQHEQFTGIQDSFK